MNFTKLRGVTPNTIGDTLRAFTADDWRNLDAFLAEVADLPFVEQVELLGVDNTGVTDLERGASNLINGLREHAEY